MAGLQVVEAVGHRAVRVLAEGVSGSRAATAQDIGLPLVLVAVARHGAVGRFAGRAAVQAHGPGQPHVEILPPVVARFVRLRDSVAPVGPGGQPVRAGAGGGPGELDRLAPAARQR